MTTVEGSTEVARIDTKAAAKIASQVEDYDALVHDAREAADDEHSMGILASIRAYPKAVFFSVGISLAIVMEGYDTILLGNLFAQPAFQKKYGDCNDAGKCQVSAAWQSGLQNGQLVGNIFGLQLVGFLTERIGYRKTMLYSLLFMAAFIFFPFFAPNLPVLLTGQILQGLPWGIYQSLAVSYAADVCPVSLRPILTTYVNLCWVIGQLLASGVLRATVERTDKWAYKLPYGLQWMWIPPIFAVCYFAPESPWWLVRQNRMDEAETSLRRLAGKSHNSRETAQKTVAMIKHTDEMEKAMHTGGGSYFDCFKGTNLRRTEIACVAWLIQTFCGSPLMGSSSYFLEQAGLPTTQAFNLTIGSFSLGALGTMSSWFIMRWAGRRTMYLYGQIIMFTILIVVGSLGASGGSPWAIGGLLLAFTAVYDASVGPACYSIVAEIGSTRLRSRTVVLARNIYNLGSIVVNIINPKMLNPNDWNLGAKSAFVWAGTGALLLVWTYFRLPEPKGRTYGELDLLFEQKVPARKFASTIVDEFGSASQQQHARAMAQAQGEKTSVDEEEKKSGDVTPPVNTLTYNA